jgi:hypothetical protein
VFSRLLPKQFDNAYGGHLPALWLLAPVLLLKLIIGVNSVGANPWISPRTVAQSADGIPLDAFGANAADTIVLLFSICGLRLLLLTLIGVLALIRYRAMIPLVYLVLLVDQLGRKALVAANPVERIGTPPADPINWVFLAAISVGLLLSLISMPRTLAKASENPA